MDAVELFGFVAVLLMVATYALERRSPHAVLAFAFSCGLSSLYALLIMSWPFAIAEAVWAVVAWRRWTQVERGAHLRRTPCA